MQLEKKDGVVTTPSFLLVFGSEAVTHEAVFFECLAITY